jgi:hypothetical protein
VELGLLAGTPQPGAHTAAQDDAATKDVWDDLLENEQHADVVYQPLLLLHHADVACLVHMCCTGLLCAAPGCYALHQPDNSPSKTGEPISAVPCPGGQAWPVGLLLQASDSLSLHHASCCNIPYILHVLQMH